MDHTSELPEAIQSLITKPAANVKTPGTQKSAQCIGDLKEKKQFNMVASPLTVTPFRSPRKRTEDASKHFNFVNKKTRVMEEAVIRGIIVALTDQLNLANRELIGLNAVELQEYISTFFEEYLPSIDSSLMGDDEHIIEYDNFDTDHDEYDFSVVYGENFDDIPEYDEHGRYIKDHSPRSDDYSDEEDVKELSPTDIYLQAILLRHEQCEAMLIRMLELFAPSVVDESTSEEFYGESYFNKNHPDSKFRDMNIVVMMHQDRWLSLNRLLTKEEMSSVWQEFHAWLLEQEVWPAKISLYAFLRWSMPLLSGIEIHCKRKFNRFIELKLQELHEQANETKNKTTSSASSYQSTVDTEASFSPFGGADFQSPSNFRLRKHRSRRFQTEKSRYSIESDLKRNKQGNRRNSMMNFLISQK